MAKRAVKTPKRAEVYQHDEQAVLRPEAGMQAQFKQKKAPKTYRYDSSLSPASTGTDRLPRGACGNAM